MENTVVYKWVREDGTPYYIGIGNPKRPYTGKRTCGYPPPKERIVILYENLSWKKACEIERKLIASYGRKDLGTGILRNLTDGGEGALGSKRSERQKRNLSKINTGKKLSEEAKRKLSDANRDKNLSKETRRKISEANFGEKNYQYTPRNWYHPVYGNVLQKTASELVRMFPKQRLSRGNLSRVASGKRPQHKGWCIVESSLEREEARSQV